MKNIIVDLSDTIFSYETILMNYQNCVDITPLVNHVFEGLYRKEKLQKYLENTQTHDDKYNTFVIQLFGRLVESVDKDLEETLGFPADSVSYVIMSRLGRTSYHLLERSMSWNIPPAVENYGYV